MEFPPEEHHGHTHARQGGQMLPAVHVPPFIICIACVLIGFFAISPGYPTLKTVAYGISGVLFGQAILHTRYERYVKSFMSIVLGTLILFVLATDLAKSKLLGAAVFMIFAGLAGLFGGVFVRRIKTRARKIRAAAFGEKEAGKNV